MYMCVSGIDISSASVSFRLDFGTVLTLRIFFVLCL